MSVKIGSSTYDLSENFQSKLKNFVKDDNSIDANELKKLELSLLNSDSQIKNDDRKLLELLQTSENLSIAFYDDDNESAKEFNFSITDIEYEIDKENINPSEFSFSTNNSINVLEAQNWEPGSTGLSGFDANKIITSSYVKLDQDVTNYLGNNPPVPNWTSFGKYASREAGEQIRNFEAILEILQNLKSTPNNFINIQKSFNALNEISKRDKSTEQALRLAFEVAHIPVPFNDVRFTPFIANNAITQFQFAKSIPKVIEAIDNLRETLVKGNTEIYDNIGTAFNIFINAENKGEDGIKALENAGYNGSEPPKVFADEINRDPQGILLESFKKYKEAKSLYDDIQVAINEGKPSSEIDKMKEKRIQIIHEANLLAGVHEQWAILQKPEIFGNQQIDDLLGQLTGSMKLHDSTTSTGYELLPNGTPGKESWADYKTRMGLKEVSSDTEGAVKLYMDDKKYHYLVPDYTQKGTITHYFKDRIESSSSNIFVNSKPQKLDNIY